MEISLNFFALSSVFFAGIYYMNSIVLTEGSLAHLHVYTFTCIHIYMYNFYPNKSNQIKNAANKQPRIPSKF